MPPNFKSRGGWHKRGRRAWEVDARDFEAGQGSNANAFRLIYSVGPGCWGGGRHDAWILMAHMLLQGGRPELKLELPATAGESQGVHAWRRIMLMVHAYWMGLWRPRLRAPLFWVKLVSQMAHRIFLIETALNLDAISTRYRSIKKNQNRGKPGHWFDNLEYDDGVQFPVATAARWRRVVGKLFWLFKQRRLLTSINEYLRFVPKASLINRIQADGAAEAKDYESARKEIYAHGYRAGWEAGYAKGFTEGFSRAAQAAMAPMLQPGFSFKCPGDPLRPVSEEHAMREQTPPTGGDHRYYYYYPDQPATAGSSEPDPGATVTLATVDISTIPDPWATADDGDDLEDIGGVDDDGASSSASRGSWQTHSTFRGYRLLP